MNQKLQRKCIVCLKEFKYNTVRGCRGMRTKGIRRGNSLTCSPSCSKIYTRISQYVHSNWIPKKRIESVIKE